MKTKKRNRQVSKLISLEKRLCGGEVGFFRFHSCAPSGHSAGRYPAMGEKKKSEPRKSALRRPAPPAEKQGAEDVRPAARKTATRRLGGNVREVTASGAGEMAGLSEMVDLSKSLPPVSPAVDGPKPLGRKRDHNRDTAILDAAMDLLAEIGFDAMTMDQVAARAKAGKATLYRRWPSKGELVRDALIGMSRSAIELDRLPDTGSLRDDLLAVVKPHSMEYHERKIRVLSGLGSFCTQHQLLYNEALEGIFRPWAAINAALMQRAIDRKDLPAHADIKTACEVIAAMTAYCVSTQRKHFDASSYERLLDHILLPGLRGEILG